MIFQQQLYRDGPLLTDEAGSCYMGVRKVMGHNTWFGKD